jgi:hypothetical protein
MKVIYETSYWKIKSNVRGVGGGAIYKKAFADVSCCKTGDYIGNLRLLRKTGCYICKLHFRADARMCVFIGSLRLLFNGRLQCRILQGF